MDYDDCVARTNEAIARMTAARTMSSEDVAKVIYGAASEGTERLRYLAGDDARGFIKARREMSDQGYINFVRAQFSHFVRDDT